MNRAALSLAELPQGARELERLRTSLAACAKALRFDLTKKTLALAAGYSQMEDYKRRSIESTFCLARVAEQQVEQALDLGDVDSFAAHLSRLAQHVVFLSQLVRKAEEHKEAGKHARVRAGGKKGGKRRAKTRAAESRADAVKLKRIATEIGLPPENTQTAIAEHQRMTAFVSQHGRRWVLNELSKIDPRPRGQRRGRRGASG